MKVMWWKRKKNHVPPNDMPPQRFWEDMRWLDNVDWTVLEPYERQWIAVYDKQIVAAGKDLDQVKAEAKEKTGRDTREIVFDFVHSPASLY